MILVAVDRGLEPVEFFLVAVDIVAVYIKVTVTMPILLAIVSYNYLLISLANCYLFF